MRVPLLLVTTLGFLIAAAPQPTPGAPPLDACVVPDTTGALVADLRTVAARLHPEAVASAEQHHSRVVALLSDDHCRVLAHALTRRAAGNLDIEATMATLFPQSRRQPFVSGGIADLIGSSAHAAGNPWLVWMMVKR